MLGWERGGPKAGKEVVGFKMTGFSFRLFGAVKIEGTGITFGVGAGGVAGFEDGVFGLAAIAE